MRIRALQHDGIGQRHAHRGQHRKPLRQGGGDERVAAGVGVVKLRQQVVEFRAAREFGLKRGERIHHRHAVLARQLAHLRGQLHQQIFRVVELRPRVGRGREENHFCPGRLRTPDHGDPRRARRGESHAPVVERVVDADQIGPQREDIAVKTRRPAHRILAADGRHDGVEHHRRKTRLQLPLQLRRIGVQRVDVRGLEIARRHAVAVKHEVHGAVARIFAPEFADHRHEIAGGIGRRAAACEHERRQKGQKKQGTEKHHGGTGGSEENSDFPPGGQPAPAPVGGRTAPPGAPRGVGPAEK